MLTKEQRDEILRMAGEWARVARFYGAREDNALQLTAAFETFSAYLDSITVPEGWKLVPVEPTEAMCDAAWASEGTDYVGEHHRIWQFAPAYRAALAAAPKPGDSNE